MIHAQLNAFIGKNKQKEVNENDAFAPLMIEHRLIERMISLVKWHLEQWQSEKKVDPSFIESAVDFIRTYADQCHHGKEENILFRKLSKKPISKDHRRIMNELLEEHRWGRKTTGKLIEANNNYQNGDAGAVVSILECMKSLVEFYPKHIEKEDRHFFRPIMKYFSKEEKEAMLNEEYRFDRMLIHEIYQNYIEKNEEKLRNTFADKRDQPLNSAVNNKN